MVRWGLWDGDATGHRHRRTAVISCAVAGATTHISTRKYGSATVNFIGAAMSDAISVVNRLKSIRANDTELVYGLSAAECPGWVFI